jgi:hypothetical protein
MYTSRKPVTPVESIFGVDVRIRHKENIEENLERYFLNPIMHKQIHGDEIYVPLDLDRIWSNH